MIMIKNERFDSFLNADQPKFLDGKRNEKYIEKKIPILRVS
jgi:hypothetical protein